MPKNKYPRNPASTSRSKEKRQGKTPKETKSLMKGGKAYKTLKSMEPNY